MGVSVTAVGGDRWAAGVTVVGFDGDDTLWHSEDAFARAQERLVDLLAAHATGEDVLARLQVVERRNLELFGYGIKGFTLSMIETAIEVSDGSVPVADIERILATGRDMLARPVELLPGVAETLPLVAGRYRIVLVTKGDLLNQESKIARSGLGDSFESINILTEKSVDSYSRVLRRLDVAPEQFLMVGNSEASDAEPVLTLGGWAALVRYPLTSLHERRAHGRPVIGAPEHAGLHRRAARPPRNRRQRLELSRRPVARQRPGAVPALGVGRQPIAVARDQHADDVVNPARADRMQGTVPAAAPGRQVGGDEDERRDEAARQHAGAAESSSRACRCGRAPPESR